MKRFLPILFFIFLLMVGVSCQRWEKRADLAAEKYYSYLIDGWYEEYLDGIAHYDSLPEFYKNQLQSMIQQYVEREKQIHGGICSVEVTDSYIEGEVANVFLKVVFADSVSEEVSLPMVRCDNIWKMQ